MGFNLKCEECEGRFEGRTMFVSCCSARCRMRKWRRTEKGKACVVRTNKKVKRLDILKGCIHCKSEFLTAKKNQELCSVCTKAHSAYYAQKRYRVKNIEKVKMLDRVGKRAQRKHYFSECCSVEGCLNEGERHHDDYNKPVDIVWLCRKHHRELHLNKQKESSSE